MCSIIGYIADNPHVSESLVSGLKRMEYRGYDSVGLATVLNNHIYFKKGTGKVNDVDVKLDLKSLQGSCGIGHTRWATHGGVSEVNAHPHLSNSGEVAVVHNGIIENYSKLRSELEKKGFVFHSKTDTEIIPNLLQFYLERNNGNTKAAILNTVSRLEGHYSFVALFGTGKMIAVKKHEPLIIGLEKDGNGYFVSSDILGFIEKTNKVIYMEDEQFVMLDNKGYEIYDFEGEPVNHIPTVSELNVEHAQKGMFPHFTLKEIYEQTKTIKETNSPQTINEVADSIRNSTDVFITGSGTSYNAALVAKYLFAKYTNVKSHAIMSSEFEYFENNLSENSTLLAISQSGESADVLNSVRTAKKKHAKIVSIVNVVHSSLVRESSCSASLNCGPEIGVAATKSFTSQLAILYQLVQKVSADTTFNIDLGSVSEYVREALYDTETSEQILETAKVISKAKSIYVIGKGLNYPIAKEGALKLKELTYIPTEGIAAGELKHGPLALIDESACVIALNPHDSSYKNVVSNVNEIKARGATIIGITDNVKPYADDASLYDYAIHVPQMPEFLYPFATVIPFQLLAYYVALEREIDPDYPRNLAKSVTVR